MERTNERCSFGTDEYGLQTGNVKTSELHDFKGHPFKAEQDIQIFELMRSIEDKGVLVPLIVRSNPYGDGYEIIAGHRRKAACVWAGIEEVSVIVRELNDTDAVVDLEEYTPSLSQANRIKRMGQSGTLDMDEMYRILEQEKPNQREQIKIRADTLAEYFPKDYTQRQKVELIESLVKEWYEKQKVQSRTSVQQKLKKSGRELLFVYQCF